MQERILAIFDQLIDKGLCVIIETHDLNFVNRWADRVIYLQDGKLLYQGNPQEVFSQLSVPDFVFNHWNMGVNTCE
jgi:ABC-type hemin transport system ATPase subunit